jgi:hypothetical protein
VGWGSRGDELSHRGAGGGEVQGLQGVHACGQGETLTEGGGEGFGCGGFGWGCVLCELTKDGPHDAAEPARGELCAPGGLAAKRLVNGDDAAHFEHGELRVFSGGVGIGENLEGGLDHLEAGAAGAGVSEAAAAAAVEFAVERETLAGTKFIFEIGAVEPHALNGFEDGRGRRG